MRPLYRQFPTGEPLIDRIMRNAGAGPAVDPMAMFGAFGERAYVGPKTVKAPKVHPPGPPGGSMDAVAEMLGIPKDDPIRIGSLLTQEIDRAVIDMHPAQGGTDDRDRPSQHHA